MGPQEEGVLDPRDTTDCGYDGSMGPVVDVRPCGCRSPLCPACSRGFAFRRAQAWMADCARMGVERVAMIVVTRDAERFPDPDHVIHARVAFHLMNHVWQVLGKAYQERWGPEPIWWAFREVHDGKRGGSADSVARGAMHLHLYFPSPSKTGRISRKKLDLIRRRGIELAGRTTWGWDRRGVYALDVSAAAEYSAKGVEYATKTAVDDRMLDSVRLALASRSRAVSRTDPANEERRKQDAKRRWHKRAAVLAYRHLRHTLGPKSEATRKAREIVREWYRPAAKRGPMRTHRERVARCGERVVFLQNRQFVGGIDLDYQFVRDVLGEESWWMPEEWFRGDGGCRFGRVIRLPLGFLREHLSGFRVYDRDGERVVRAQFPSLPLPTGGSPRGSTQSTRRASGARAENASDDELPGSGGLAFSALTAGSSRAQSLRKGQGASGECVRTRAAVWVRPIAGGFLGAVRRFCEGRGSLRAAASPHGRTRLQAWGTLRRVRGRREAADILVRWCCSVLRGRRRRRAAIRGP